MSRNRIKFIYISVVSLAIVTMGCIGVMKKLSPFQTEEQMQVKALYSKSIKNTNDFTLLWVDAYIKESSLVFGFSLWDENNEMSFSESELSEMNLIVEQMIKYLNEVDNLDNIYNNVQLKFYNRRFHNNEYMWLIISYGDNGYYFDGLSSVHCNDLCDFYMMTNVTRISLDGSNELKLNDEKLERLSNLKNLKEIYYAANIDGDYLYLLKKKLQIILPECKLYEGDKEIVIEDE